MVNTYQLILYKKIGQRWHYVRLSNAPDNQVITERGCCGLPPDSTVLRRPDTALTDSVAILRQEAEKWAAEGYHKPHQNNLQVMTLHFQMPRWRGYPAGAPWYDDWVTVYRDPIEAMLAATRNGIAATPQLDDILTAVYRISGSPMANSQVLCSSTGTGTNQTTFLSLGTCTIPADVLQTGDRIEVSFHYTHEGDVSAFDHQLLWGGTALISESLPSTETGSVGRFSAAAGTAMVYWSGQTWGDTSTMATSSGSLASSFATPITIDFQAQLASAAADTVTLRNFSVIRHPKP